MDPGIEFKKETESEAGQDQQKGLGLRPKMAFLFVVIPIILVAVSGLIHLKQMDSLSSMLTQESSSILENIGQQVIAGKARSVAEQCRKYLQKNPQLRRQDFSKDKEFAGMAMQKVGKTGYTALYSIPDKTGISHLWVHPNEKIIGIDLLKVLRKPLGDRYEQFTKVYTGVFNGKESQGYYLWKDKDGQFREKFMVCTPIGDTPFVIASTTYMDEFTLDLKQMSNRAQMITRNSRNTGIQILVGTLIILAIVVALFSNGLSKRVRTLTKLAERISLGELDIQNKDKSKDEIGQLASAIERMRNSIRISMEILRSRS
jgi:HAMP domain-containing protein